MANLALIVITIAVVCADAYKISAKAPNKPVWPKRYNVAGILYLPYVEIAEPFFAYYDVTGKRSRIDYYGDMDVTIQRGDLQDFGQNYKIVPVTTEKEENVATCLLVNGTSAAPVAAQAALPDVSNFTYGGTDMYNGESVDVWTMTTTVGSKVNKYTLYTTQNIGTPKYYEMMGYDSLFGSHYDKYKIDYILFDTEFSADVFDIPIKDKKCIGFPGPGHESSITFNPMQEYMHPVNDAHVHTMFSHFTDKFEKDYVNKSPDEYSKRKDIFRMNVRYINSINRKNLSYKLRVNHLADQSSDELAILRGRRPSKSVAPSGNHVKNSGLPFVSDVKIEDVPDTMDWRLRGAVTPVKDQAVCGSCWSFGTTGTIEGALFLKTKRLIRLSQQSLVDCSWGYGNNGCDGGEEFRAIEWMMKHGGIVSEDSYGPYLGQDGYCHVEDAEIVAKIDSYVNVTAGDQIALKTAIYEHGPVAVDIDASHLSLSFYANGVYYEPKCGNKPENLDHSVLAVGYGTMDGEKYWLVKNSWSTHWGNDGYVLMSQKDNNCGVATSPTYVNLK